MADLQSYIKEDSPSDIPEATVNGIDESKDTEDVNLIRYFENAVRKLEGLFKKCKSEEALEAPPVFYYLKELSSFLKKRVLIEKEHHRSLTKLLSSLAEEKQLKFEGAIGDSWEELKERFRQGTEDHQTTITSLETQALQPLKRTVVGELEGKFKQVVHEATQVIQSYNTQRMSLYKAREKYKKHCIEWEATLLTMYHELGEEWVPNPRNKLFEKEESLFKKMTEHRDEYVMETETTNWLMHAVFTNSMPELTKALYNIAKDVITILTEALQSFTQAEIILDRVNKEEDHVSSSLPQLDAKTHTLNCVFGGMELEKVLPPLQFTFQEHLLQDEAALVHTKKIQYQCRAGLNATELVAQGAAFTHSISLSHTAPNPNLIQACVDYLSLPKALKEEGLFRVPGDATIIRKYHLAYLEAAPNYTLLQQNIMEELDPNNISGLLKLHLRENPLFSAKTFTAIREKFDHLDNQDVKDLPNVILESVSKQELEILVKLVELFCLVIEHTSENRMTSNALAMSCGLSFFPQFKIGEASSIMLHFIEHSDAVKEKLHEPNGTTVTAPYVITPDSPA